MENLQGHNQQRENGTSYNYILYNTKHTIQTEYLFFNQTVFLICLQVFEASSEGHTVAFNSLFPPITARYLQLWPQRWHSRVAVKLQVLGCPLAGLQPRSKPDGEAPSLHSLYTQADFSLSFFSIQNCSYSTTVISPRNFRADFA